MKKLGIIFYVVLLLTCAVSAQELKGEGGDFYTTISKSFKVGEGGNFNAERITGDFDISTWEKEEVAIQLEMRIRSFTRGEAEEVYRRAQTSFSMSGKTVYVKGDFNGDNGRVENHFTVTLPKRFNVRIETSGGDIFLTQLEGEVEMKTSGGDIHISETSGRVRVSTSGGDMIFSQVSGEIDANTSGGDIDLRKIFGRGRFNTSGGDIALDEASNEVSLNTSGGDIQVKRAQADLSANTSGGDIAISDCIGKCSVNTSGGNISLERMKGNVSARTSGGDIVGADFEEPVSVSTSGGEIRLTNVRAAVFCETSGGDIDVQMSLADFSKNHAVELRTSGGKITLTLPEKLPATITAEIRTSRGNYRMERYDIYSDFPLTKTKPDEDGEVVIHSEGDINGGGDPIKLETTSGDIYIKKAK
jgi:DUF4097 and DUF4098 domain-containing protein YvlB